MAIEQVKLNCKALKCAVPETLKINRGRIGLFRGKFARVEIWTSKAKPLCLCRKIGDETKRTFFGLNEITLANDTARHFETQGSAHRLAFGTLSDDEERAISLFRKFAAAQAGSGNPLPPLSELVKDMIFRETHKNETPPFSEVAFRFLEWKDAQGGISLVWRNRVAARLKALSAHFGKTPMSEITETAVLDALPKITRSRDKSAAPSQKTQKHWTELLREVFKWFYARENAKRRAAEKLTNPLEILAAPKSAAAREAEILTPAKVRAILADLWTHTPAVVPAAAVQLFCGVREAEAMRLRWRDIRDGKVFLSKEITKTKKSRSAPVPANLAAWLNAFAARFGVPAPESLLFPFNDVPASKLAGMTAAARERVATDAFTNRTQAFVYRLSRSAKRLGFPVPANAFRHSAVSYLAEIHGHSRAADFCGHSVDVQGIHYRANVSAREAQDYFGIMPPQGDGKAVAFSRERAAAGTNDGAGTDEAAAL